jgi:hypothetical protein
MRCCQVDWLLMSNIGEVIKKIVDSQAFPDYQVPRKRGVRTKRRQKRGTGSAQ